MIWGCVCEGVSWGRLTLEPATQETDGPPHEMGLTQPTEGPSRTTGQGGRNPPPLLPQGVMGTARLPFACPGTETYLISSPGSQALVLTRNGSTSLAGSLACTWQAAQGTSLPLESISCERQCLPKAPSSQHTSRAGKSTFTVVHVEKNALILHNESGVGKLPPGPGVGPGVRPGGGACQGKVGSTWPAAAGASSE